MKKQKTGFEKDNVFVLKKPREEFFVTEEDEKDEDEKEGILYFKGSEDIVESVLFPPTAVFVRKSYNMLLSFVLKPRGTLTRSKFVITGTPGIGKSMFKYYILYRLLFTNLKVFGNQIEDVLLLSGHGRYHIWRADDGEIKFRRVRTPADYDFYYEPGSKLSKHTAVLWDPSNVPGQEAVSVISTGAALQMAFVSPNELANLRGFVKANSPNSIIYMPLWSDEELEKLRASLFDEHVTLEESRSIAELSGNNPRLTLQWTAQRDKDVSFDIYRNEYRDSLVTAIDQLDIDKIKSLMKVAEISQHHLTANSSTNHYKHLVIEIDLPLNRASLNSNLIVRPCSEFVRKELTFIFFKNKLENHMEVMKNLLDAASGDGRAYAGWMFEWYAHYELAKTTNRSCVYLADPDSSIDFQMNWSGRKVFRSMKEIEGRVEVNHYYLPAHQTLASIDSFVVSNSGGDGVLRVFAFQMTVASSHPVKHHGLKALHDLVKKGVKVGVETYIEPTFEYYLVFVAPEHQDDSKTMRHLQKVTVKDSDKEHQRQGDIVYTQLRLDLSLVDLRLMRSGDYRASSSTKS